MPILGSTVLDLAFAIHTQLGTHCIAGKINHRLVPISYKLDSGDQVEIITSDSQTPQPEWMQFCNSAKAQNRLRAILRKDRRHLTERGKKLYDEFLEREGVENTPDVMTRLLGNLHLPHKEDLYLMLANDEINLSAKQLKDLNKTRSSLLSKILRNPFCHGQSTLR